MSDILVITVAGKPYTIGLLTVGQLQDLNVGVMEEDPEDPQEKVRAQWNRNVRLLAVALSEDHADMTEEAVRKLRLGTNRAVSSAVTSILKFAGLISEKVPDSGEAQAANPAA